MSKSLSFYATSSDLKTLLAEIESKRPLRYVVAGSSSTQAARYFDSALQVPDLGVAREGDQSRETFFLVTNANTDVEVQTVPQRRGGILYFIDQERNPRSIVLRPGGLFQNECIIAGQVGTASTDEESEDLLKLFSKAIRKKFVKINSYYVGQEANHLLDSGMRLTTGVRSPVEYDLRKE